MKIKRIELTYLLICLCIVFSFVNNANTQSKSFESLVADLGSNDPSVRKNAVRALGRLKDTRATEPLLTALKDEDTYVRGYAARALGELRDPHTVEPLVTALKDQYFVVRRNAATALGKIGDPGAVEPLILALKDKSSYVRQDAAAALGELKDRRSAVPLLDALNDKSAVVGMKAAWALGELKDSRTSDPLIAVLEDNNTHLIIRAAVAEALYNIDDTKALEPLISALNCESSILRQRVERILKKSKDQRAIEALAAAHNKKETDFRIKALSDKSYAFANFPTLVTIFAEIARNPNLILESVSLCRVENNKRLVKFASLHKDLGTGVKNFGFSTQVTINESTPAKILFKVTAAYKNTPKQTESEPIVIVIKEKPNIEKTILEIITALRNGDYEFAKTKFARSSRDDILDKLDSRLANLLADWIEKAKLIEDSPEYKAYKSEWIDEKGAKNHVEFIFSLNRSGDWVIISW